MSTTPKVRSGPVSHSGPGTRELGALLLILGAVLLLVLPLGLLWAVGSWTLGVALLWSSARWSTPEKLLGTLVWPGGLIGPLALLTSASRICTQAAPTGAGPPTMADPVCTGSGFDPVVGIPLAVVVSVAPVVVAGVLLHRAWTTEP